MKLSLLWPIILLGSAVGIAADDYASAKQKLLSIQQDRLQPGSRVELTPRELDAYAAHQAPAGVRNPQITITASGIATGTAIVDFNQVRRSLGQRPGWLASKLLEGDRPVSVTARITSSGGRATIDVRKVVISGMGIDGATLEFVIDHVLRPLYPSAAIGRPFPLGHRVEKLDITPRGAGILIGR